MAKKLEVKIGINGELEIEGLGLSRGEQVKDVAKFLTDSIGDTLDYGHKHTHEEEEQHTERLVN